ncbi:ABC transporter transmembrane domain-containing protein [Serpentinimonas barnesii]|uniref:ABC transporter transmembrane domain-containing protein n=1 Tax=Serpentinimonas barnesii TaxID=1458427 RepID=UPI0009E29282|nr:ABC transporter transmembrane domain-containing protein [Serpentinimonas barnesii]
MLVPGQLASLRALWRVLAPRRRRQFALLLVLMVLAAFAEVVSIAAVLPFLSIMIAPERVFQLEAASPFIDALGLTQPSELLLPITLAFGAAVLLAGVIRLCLLWVSTRLSFAAGADISIDIYRRTLYQPYSVHAGRNSSEVITGISTKSNTVIFQIIDPALRLISASLMLVAILLLLLSIHTTVALAAMLGFGLIYLLVIGITRKPLERNSAVIATESNQLIKSLQEGLGGIRDVLLDGTQPAFCAIYRKADLALRHAQGTNMFLGQFPRFVVETLGILLIAALAYALTQQEQGVAAALPVLGALALGAQRMLPLLNIRQNPLHLELWDRNLMKNSLRVC